MRKIIIMKQIKITLVFLLALSGLNAQINPSPSQYFYNRLFQNVAATGMEKGVRLDAAYRNMTPNSFTGSPVNTMLSVQGMAGLRSGLGLQFQNERAGLLNRSRTVGSYAIDLGSQETRIRLGVGLGMMMTRVNTLRGSLIRGDVNDPVIAAFNNNRMKIDGSIGGLIETKSGWEIMASAPSIGSIQEYAGYNAIDYVLFNAMVSKKLKLSKDDAGEVSFQPMLGYRMMQGVSDIVDLGGLLSYKSWIRFMGIYHSNNEVALGVGIPYKDKMTFDFTYNSGKVYNKTYLNVGGTIEMHVMFKF